MQHLHTLSFVLLVLVGVFPGCRSLPTSGRHFERSYNEKFRLSAEEERDVIALAAEMGVTEIEKIETVSGQVPLISVKEKESLSGRMVSFRTITMYSKKWGEWLNLEKLAETTVSEGLILADQPKTVELSILTLDGAEYRVTLGDGVAPSEAEAILNCFFADKFRFIRKPTVEEDYIRIKDFSDPSTIKLDNVRGLHVVTFDSKESSRSSSYYGSLKGGIFVVHRVVTIQFG